ncbi:hypothetical protein HZR84_01075 [Hyphobacterium sp. CCMP332]|nr:hypothetical protein HZR84_01075 [Hyphobacterium sp. CCMP332]
MRRFLKTLLFFFILLLAVIYPLDRLFSISLAKTEIGEFSVWNDILEAEVEDPLLIYGSSRAWVQIDPQIIEDSLGISAYNFGIDGHNFQLQYLRHSLNLKYNGSPEYIIQIVDHATLQKRPDLYNLNQFLPYMLFNEHFYKYTSDYLGFEKYDFFIPLIRYSGNTNAMANILFSWYGKVDSKKIRYKGFRANDKTWNKDFDRAKNKFKSYKIDLDSQSIDLFEDFIIECQNNSTKLILVYPPEYIEGQLFIENRASLINLYENIASKHSLLFLDYSKDEINYNKDFFYNVLHLNKNGSKVFSATLANDLKSILKPQIVI